MHLHHFRLTFFVIGICILLIIAYAIGQASVRPRYYPPAGGPGVFWDGTAPIPSHTEGVAPITHS